MEAGFVFSNSIVLHTVKEPELPVVCSNKPKLRLHLRHTGPSNGQSKNKNTVNVDL